MAEFKRSTIKELFSEYEVEAPKGLISKLCDLNMESVDGFKDSLKETQDKLDKVTKENDTLKAKVPADGTTVSKEEFDTLKSELDGYKEKETNAAKEKAYLKLLKDSKMAESIIPLLMKASANEIKGLELDKDGNVKDAEKHMKEIETSFGDYVEKTTQQGAKTANPPSGSSSGKKTREEIAAITDREERRQAIAENLDIFK